MERGSQSNNADIQTNNYHLNSGCSEQVAGHK